MSRLLAFALVAICLLPQAHAEKRAWGCLVFANLEAGESNPILEAYLPELRKNFGYLRYDVLGSAWATDSVEKEAFIRPTEEFFLRILPLEGLIESHRVTLELHQKDKVLVKSDVEMPLKAPLLITGPQYGKGKLIIIVELREFTPVDKP